MSIQSIIAIAARGVRCDEDMPWAVSYVESSLGRHLRRFEPHLFKRETGAVASSYSAALKINPEAAARCCSIGMFQVLGRWHQQLGYETAQDMMAALMDVRNVQDQADSFIGYCMKVEPQAGAALRAGDLERFALLYNGPKAIERGYNTKLRAAVKRAGGDVTAVIRLGSSGDAVWLLQRLLRDQHGFPELKPDGWFGASTEEALRAFQERSGLTVDGIVGRKTWTALKARGSDLATMPKRSAGEVVEDFMRQRPGRSLTILTAVSGFLANQGFSGGAQFVDSVAVGDWGTAGSYVIDYLPYAVALGMAALAVWIIWTAINIYRDQRAVAASLSHQKEDDGYGHLYRTERIRNRDHRREWRDGDDQAEWGRGAGSGNPDGQDADSEHHGSRRGSDAGGQAEPVHHESRPRPGTAARASAALALFGRGGS